MQVRNTGKKESVRVMFNSISTRYDFLNHFLSFGIDILWRKKLVRMLRRQNPTSILDVATGTADLAIEASRIKNARITGVDIAEEMLEVGHTKVLKKGLSKVIDLQYADSENLPFDAFAYDASIVSFGVRNFENLGAGLDEMFRVLKPNGRIYILEFSMPTNFPILQLYNFYFKFILPLIGRLISKDKSAYTYLYDSVQDFPSGKDFLIQLQQAGFASPKQHKLSFGIASIYTAIKTDNNTEK
ncbi:MAG: bifunctional demethylmenaquinone methyltransferase/2-methoxy-6-polyprenyl-1,4-benzoquinol methylase UbiE [Bacteroidetes bacterium]|nr:bifunctional demethylmenaquinone methyltransferase/2-methoxy-6-polyprenyl-1,4-benzoquinol methylase UbiE [Bacteroidota bacterium]